MVHWRWVLPLTALSGKSWEKIRSLWFTEYRRPTVVTIAEGGSHTRSFSADTGMAECLFVANKGRPSSEPHRATFVVLSAQPVDALAGEQIAETIAKLRERDDVRTLEGGPYGGSRLVIGSTAYGELLDCPLPPKGAWQIAGIKDLTLAQTAHQLTQGRLWIEGMREEDAPVVPVTELENIIRRIGPHHLDLTGPRVKGDGLQQGPFEKLDGCPSGAAYPCLWNHEAARGTAARVGTR